MGLSLHVRIYLVKFIIISMKTLDLMLIPTYILSL